MEGGRATTRGGDSARGGAIAERLAEVLGEAGIDEVRRLSGGASRETYVLDAGPRGELILQCEHAGKPTGEPPGQAALLEAAKAAGVPVPAVVAHGREDPVLGAAWTLVEALAGTSDPKQIVPDRQAARPSCSTTSPRRSPPCTECPPTARSRRRPRSRSRSCGRCTTASASPTPSSSSPSARSAPTGRRRAGRSCTETSAWAT